MRKTFITCNNCQPNELTSITNITNHINSYNISFTFNAFHRFLCVCVQDHFFMLNKGNKFEPLKMPWSFKSKYE